MNSTYLSSADPIPTQSLILDHSRSCSLFNHQLWQPIKVSFDTKWSYTISASQEPADIDDLLRITKNALKINVQKRPRMNPIDAWKDPDGCCQRMGILWKEALEMIIVPLRKKIFLRGPSHRETQEPRRRNGSSRFIRRRRLNRGDVYTSSFRQEAQTNCSWNPSMRRASRRIMSTMKKRTGYE
jgi:hypothetical protein